MEDCLFCRIARKEIDAEIIAERDRVIAFPDINPQAPVHILIVPREHIPTIGDMDLGDCELMADIFAVINDAASSKGIDQTGYRLVCNIGRQAGQEIDHLHFHLLGGRGMSWPPG